jgi:steroid delta-isomerase-like uncharacterized protein
LPSLPFDRQEVAMTRDEMMACLLRRRRYWDVKDVAGLTAMHAPDGEIESPMFGPIRGRAEIERTFRKMFEVFEDMTFDYDEPLIDGDRAVQPFLARATHRHEVFGMPATGRRFEVRGALFYDFAGGYVSRERRLYDFTSLLVQLGVFKPKVTA